MNCFFLPHNQLFLSYSKSVLPLTEDYNLAKMRFSSIQCYPTRSQYIAFYSTVCYHLITSKETLLRYLLHKYINIDK